MCTPQGARGVCAAVYPPAVHPPLPGPGWRGGHISVRRGGQAAEEPALQAHGHVHTPLCAGGERLFNMEAVK